MDAVEESINIVENYLDKEREELSKKQDEESKKKAKALAKRLRCENCSSHTYNTRVGQKWCYNADCAQPYDGYCKFGYAIGSENDLNKPREFFFREKDITTEITKDVMGYEIITFKKESAINAIELYKIIWSVISYKSNANIATFTLDDGGSCMDNLCRVSYNSGINNFHLVNF